MRSAFFYKFAKEPWRTGLSELFTTLSAIAFVNLTGDLIFKNSGAAGAPMLVLALLTSMVVSGIAVLRSSKITQQKSLELHMAQALAEGDLSKSVAQMSGVRSTLQNALSAIAEHQLNTERKYQRLMQEASMRQKHLSSALDCLPNELAVFNASGLLLYANASYLNKCSDVGATVALGMTRGEILAEIAKAPKSYLPLNERQTWIKALDQLHCEALASLKPIRFTRASQECAQITCQLTKDGHALESVSDISATVHLEERAAKAELQANAAVRQSKSTLTRLSHTIRTPMNGVLAAAELLSGSEMDTKQRLRLDIIRRSAGTLLGVVQDMFELASGDETLTPEVSAPVVERRQHALICATSGTLARQDGAHLSQLDFEFTLLDSAQGAADADRSLALDDRNEAKLIVLADETQRGTISSAFEKANLATRPDLKLFSELLSQTGDAETAPPPKTRSQTAPLNLPAKLKNLDALVVESGEVNQICFGNYLADTSYSFEIASNGADAIAAIKAGLPRLILLDVSLPDTDGLNVTRIIRQTIVPSQSNYAPVIIGMANNFVQGDLVKCVRAGMNNYVAKPLTAHALRTLVDEWLAREPLKIAC